MSRQFIPEANLYEKICLNDWMLNQHLSYTWLISFDPIYGRCQIYYVSRQSNEPDYLSFPYFNYWRWSLSPWQGDYIWSACLSSYFLTLSRIKFPGSFFLNIYIYIFIFSWYPISCTSLLLTVTYPVIE